jgi:preprotein translocase subunit YajC
VQRQERRRRQVLAQLEVGDEVLTQAGFIATVKDIIVPALGRPTEILLDLGNGVEVRALASAIFQRWPARQAPEGLLRADASRSKG